MPSTGPLCKDLRGLDSLSHGQAVSWRPRPLHRVQAPLDAAVIVFDPVVTVSPGSLSAGAPQVSLGL
jgi:hypothetical protein